MRHKITIPAAGEELRVKVQGYSVITETGKIYIDAPDVPLLGFNSGNNQLGLYPRSTYGNDGIRIESIIITGTAASAGDEFYILSTDECLKTNLNIIYKDQYSSEPGTTFTKAGTNAVQELTELELVDADGNLPTVLYVSVSPTAGTSGIKWAINADPVQGDDSLGSLLSPGDEPIPVKDINWMLAFRFISAVLDETPVVNFTPEY